MSADCAVYVRLLDEGTKVYKPVPAVLKDGIYHLTAPEGYESDGERWEFPPGSKVFCREMLVGGKMCFVASQLAEVER